MTALDRLACKMGRNDEAPNQELARELALSGDAAAISEIAAGLDSPDRAVQSDCIKVLYEIGYIRPEPICRYADTFLRLLASKNNRLVWGAMIVLSTIARLSSKEIAGKINTIYHAMDNGSVITIDNGIKVLAGVAAGCPEMSDGIVGYLLEHLRTCRAKEVPQHAESTLPAISRLYSDKFIAVLKSREEDMTPAQSARIRKLYKAIDKLKQ